MRPLSSVWQGTGDGEGAIRGSTVVGGGRIEFLDFAGTAYRSPLVLLHEGLGSVGLWRGLPGRLRESTSRRVIAFSRHGHGDSDPPPQHRRPDFMHREACEILPTLLARLGVSQPILVGHSDGASIGLIYAAGNPVAGLVLLAPHVFVEEITLAGIRQAEAMFEAGNLRGRMARHHRDPDVTFRNWCGVWLHPDFRNWNLAALLESVRAPVLLIQGEDDPYGTLAQLEAIERGVAGATSRLVVPGGHSPHLESPDITIEAINRFVERLG
jgi:pimeloyl-ACP methyl ester carboxylesterase